jgi:hypothetical protein
MNQTYLNQTGVPLSVAVYLAADMYDYVPDTISATSLIKPIRQLVLAPRVPAAQAKTDVVNLVKSRLGTSIHDGIEKAWSGDHYKRAMLKLGYPESVISKILINPDPADVEPGQIPVYMEQRLFRQFMGHRISGKFDFIAEGRLEDFKSTSTFTWVNDTKSDDYQLQGSIYRWLDADSPARRITEDYMVIQFFFTDWMAGRAKADKNYPQRQVEPLNIPLLSLEDTEDFVASRLTQYARYKDHDESGLPRCTDKELWRKAPVWKYYRNPEKRARSTKNFDSPGEAYAQLTKDGNVGVVVEVPGEVVACKYCPAFPVCTQKDEYLADGSLKLD